MCSAHSLDCTTRSDYILCRQCTASMGGLGLAERVDQVVAVVVVGVAEGSVVAGPSTTTSSRHLAVPQQ